MPATTLAARVLAALLVTCSCGCLYFSTERQISYGLTHYEMGLYEQAIPPLMTAARSLEKESPPDPRLVDVLIALGTMAVSEERNDLAGDFFARALKAAEALRPADERRLRNALVNLGMFYAQDDRRPREAIPLLERAAAISSGYGDRELYAIDLDNLGFACQQAGMYAEGSKHSLEALAVIETVSTGSEREKTRGVILHNLAMSYAGEGRNAEAEERFRQSVAVLESAPGVEPWRLETARHSYAEFLRRTGRAKEARELESRWKGARSSEPGPHPAD